jgi:hypothetical protein
MPAAARKQASLPSPAEILDLIAARKAELPALLKEQTEAAEQSITSGDKTQYCSAVDAVKAAHADIERLQVALIGATARSREAAEARQRAAQAAIRERFYKRIDERLPLARKIEGKITELVHLWHEWIAVNTKAYEEYPNGPPPTGLGLTNSEALHQFAAELYRQGGVAPVTGRPQLERLPPTIPGARCPDFMMLAQPEKIASFSGVIGQANAHARTVVESKKAEVSSDIAVPAPVPVMNGGPRSAAKEALGSLLRKQAAMVEDPSIDEAEYKRLIDQIAEAQAAVTDEQQLGAQQHG